MKISDLPRVVPLLKAEFESRRAPIMELVAAQTSDPFAVLLGTILSARTKDACTTAAITRLLKVAPDPKSLAKLSVEEIEKLIFPVGFFHVKARHLKELPGVLERRFGGRLPDTVEELCELPGVGRKTANLVVALGFEKPAICVDVHVHRISNRFGLLKTKTPFETEMRLREILPIEYWIVWNSYIVAFGQNRCHPRNPHCDGCPVRAWCDAAGRESAKPRAARNKPTSPKPTKTKGTP